MNEVDLFHFEDDKPSFEDYGRETDLDSGMPAI